MMELCETPACRREGSFWDIEPFVDVMLEWWTCLRLWEHLSCGMLENAFDGPKLKLRRLSQIYGKWQSLANPRFGIV